MPRRNKNPRDHVGLKESKRTLFDRTKSNGELGDPTYIQPTYNEFIRAVDKRLVRRRAKNKGRF